MNQNNMQNNQVPNNFNQNPNGQMMPNNMGPGPRPNGQMPNMGPGPRPNGQMPNMGPGPMPNNAGPGPRPNGPMPNMGPGPGPNGPMPNNVGPGPRPNGPMPNMGPGPRPNGPMPNMGPGPGPRPNGPMPNMGPGPRPNGPMPNMAPVPPVAPQAVPDQSPIEKHKHSSDADMVYCNGCGSLINKNSRYCMKCGSLNYSHPENMDMKKYAWVKLKDGFFVKGVSDKVNGKKGLFGSPFTVCFIFNVLLHVILALVLSSYIKTGFSNFEIELNTLLVYGMFFIMFIYNYSMQSIYIKAGAPWWAYFIPFYGQYIFFEIAIGNGWLFLISFIPVINIFLMIMVLYTLGKKFYRNGFLTVLFPFIMIPVIGLSDHMELSSIDLSVVDEYGRTAAEKQYKIRKLISTAIFIVIIGVVLLLYWDFFYGIAKYLWNIFVDSLKFFEEKNS